MMASPSPLPSGDLRPPPSAMVVPLEMLVTLGNATELRRRGHHVLYRGTTGDGVPENMALGVSLIGSEDEGIAGSPGLARRHLRVEPAREPRRRGGHAA